MERLKWVTPIGLVAMLQTKIEDIREHRSVVDYTETEHYHEFVIKPYGNCSVIGDITEHKHGNFGVEGENIKARIKK
jgi:hypothetical protein